MPQGRVQHCEGELIAGEVTQPGKGTLRGKADAMLMCRAKPRSDLDILPKRIERREPPVRKKL